MCSKVRSSSEGLDVSHLSCPLGKASELKVACSDVASSPLYTAFLSFSHTPEGARLTCYVETCILICCSWSVLYGQAPLGKGIASLLFDDARG